jgi:hypothetical protein
MTKISCTIFLLLFVLFVKGQPTIQWQKSFGGTANETSRSIIQTLDGGYIVAGGTTSNDGDVSINKGGTDFWVIKLDVNGIIEWEKSYGGSLDESAYSISQTIDKGYIVSGFSNSNDGDVSINKGLSDCWIIKLDSLGNLEWENSYGGSAGENANSIKQTMDGGYIFAGFSGSVDGDVSGHHGGVSFSDFWVVKIDISGVIEWEKSYGGTSYEYAFDIELTQNEGYIVVGEAISTDGDVTNNNGGKDYWVVKIDTLGNIEWEKNYGGSGNESINSIQTTIDGGYIIAGASNSTDGDVTSASNGGFDAWIIKIDSLGVIEWEKLYGGSFNDNVQTVQKTVEKNYIFTGKTGITSFDYWVVEIDSLGGINWQQTYGGSSSDYAYYISQTTDNGFIVCGATASMDGDVTGNNGADDFWVVKLNASTDMIENDVDMYYNLYPNPFNDEIKIDVKPNTLVEVYNAIGQQIISFKILKGVTKFNTTNLDSGCYYIRLVNSHNIFTIKAIKL